MGEVISYVIVLILWITAIVHDASHNILGWLIADILIFPLGVIRGIVIMFGGG